MRRAFFLARMSLVASTALTAGAPAAAANGPAALAPHVTAGMPAEFAALSQTQLVVADVYFGGRRIGQFEIDVSFAGVRFLHPDQLAAAILDLIDPAEVAQALTGTLDTNAKYLCGDASAVCDRPQPAVAAIIYDAQRFRVEVIVNARLLSVRGAAPDLFLEPFSKTPSLVDTIGGAIAGGGGQRSAYNLRNRGVLAVGTARLLSESSLSSGRGFNMDTLAAQLDRPNRRYQAGLFYASGADLVGRRRIVGIGVETQFDTLADRLELSGSPLIVFLAQRSRVDLFVQGRLIGSHTFEAGNQLLDTSSFPDGSYPVEIRIQEAGGATRTEQRFFTKSTALAPVGRVIFFANAGLLAVDRENRWLSVARVPLMSAGAAGRIGAHIAWDATVTGSDQKALVEVGATLLTEFAQARVAVLGSSARDHGIVAQIGSTTAGALSYNFDLRHVHSSDGKALIPLDDYARDAFSIADIKAQHVQAAGPTFTQLIGNVSYHLANGQIGLSGYFRHDASRDATYAIGPTSRWSILRRGRLQMTLNGNYAATNRGHSFATGLQLQILGRHSSLSAMVGAQTNAGADGRAVGDVAEVAASVQRENVLGGEFAGSAVVQHGGNGTVVQLSADERSPAGYAALSLVDHFAGVSDGLQYGLTGQTSIAIGHRTMRVGTHDQNDSVITVGVRGSAPGARFDVVIDDADRGEIGVGEKIAIAVTPYRRYKVRLRAVGAELVTFDARTRNVDVYPGTVAALDWKAASVLAMFGRLIWPDGTPIANADITADDAIAATDDRGYFQLQAPSDARLSVRGNGGVACETKLDAHRSPQGYTPLGDVTCTS